MMPHTSAQPAVQRNGHERLVGHPPAEPPWETEVFLLQAEDRPSLPERARELSDFLARNPGVALKDLAWSLNSRFEAGQPCLALVADTAARLQGHLKRAIDRLADQHCRQIRDFQGCYYFAEPLYLQGKLAFVFPGEGSQYLNMLADLFPHFPEVVDYFHKGDALSLRARRPRPISEALFLSAEASTAAREKVERELWRLDNAIPGVLTADWAMYALLGNLGIRPHAFAGHSAGEFSALAAAGCLQHSDELIERLFVLGHVLQRQHDEGNMAEFVLVAVTMSRSQAQRYLQRWDSQVQVAMDNCPHQCVLAGPLAQMEQMLSDLKQQGVNCTILPFRRPYHTPMFEPLLAPIASFYEAQGLKAPKAPLYSCFTGGLFPAESSVIHSMALRHWASPVEFVTLVEQMYADGIRIFVEVGPRNTLTSFIEDTLRGRSFAAVPSNMAQRPAVTAINHLVAVLAAHHVPLRLQHLYERRNPRRVDWEKPRQSAPDSRPLIPVGAHASSRSQVMEQYLAVMEDFLAVEQEVMQSYLARQHSRSRPHTSVLPPLRPLLGAIVRHEPGRELVIRRSLDLAEDLYALDHTLGARNASALDPQQHGLPFMPMAFSLEMMAEAASLLLPGRLVVGMQKVRLQRWIPFDDEPTTLELRAQVRPEAPDEVSISLYDLGNHVQPGSTEVAAVFGTVLLADHYPEPPELDSFPLTREGPCRYTPHQLYAGECRLFHGPVFQALASIDRCGEEGIEGWLEALPHARLFRSTSEPDLLTDPLLIDASTHLLGAWHLHQADQAGRVVLPYELGSVSFHGPRPAVGTPVKCRVHILRTTARQVSHRLDLVGPDGQLWCRLDGAEYWRFYWPDEYVEFFRHKDQFLLGFPWPSDISSLGHGACCLALVPPPDLCNPVKRSALAHIGLTPQERQYFRLAQLDDAKQTAWLFGRLVAKDAIRAAWHARHGQHLFPADIDLPMEGASGLTPHYRDPTQLTDLPRVCIAQAGKHLVALAAFSDRLGLEIVSIATGSSVEWFELHASEERLLAGLSCARQEALARYAAARGALTRALPMPAGQAGTLILRDIPQADVMLFATSPRRDSHRSALDEDLVVCRVFRDADVCLGITFCERASR